PVLARRCLVADGLRPRSARGSGARAFPLRAAGLPALDLGTLRSLAAALGLLALAGLALACIVAAGLGRRLVLAPRLFARGRDAAARRGLFARLRRAGLCLRALLGAGLRLLALRWTLLLPLRLSAFGGFDARPGAIFAVAARGFDAARLAALAARVAAAALAFLRDRGDRRQGQAQHERGAEDAGGKLLHGIVPLPTDRVGAGIVLDRRR